MKDFFDGTMEFWCKFIDSLSSRGGAIFLLFLATTIFGGALIHIMHHGDTGESASLIRNSFAGVFGALLLALKTGADKAANGNGKPKDPTPPAATPAS